MSILRVAIVSLTALGAGIACAAKPVQGPADLATSSITFKLKCKETTCTVNNLTAYVNNNGTGDAANAQLSFYLSNDDILTTETDLLLHTVSLGKVKAGKSKKKTLGGGHLKQAAATAGQYVFTVIDPSNTLVETDENNNIYGQAIPSQP